MSLFKQTRLVTLLLKRSNESNLDWQPTVDGYGFQVSFKDNSVRIRREDGDRGSIYFVDLINDEGAVVETFTDEDLDGATDEGLGGKNYKRLSELHELAKRTALGSEKVLNDILSELDDEIPF